MLPKFRLSHFIVVMLSIMMAGSACHNYYQASTRNLNQSPDKRIDSLHKLQRYFILRTPIQTYNLGKIELSSDRKSIKAILDTLPVGHKLHVSTAGQKMRYKTAQAQVLNEVHLYIGDDTPINPGEYTLQLKIFAAPYVQGKP